MRKKVCLMLLFLIMFFTGNIVSAISNYELGSLEVTLNDISDFEESGVMVSYKTNRSQDEEINQLKENLQSIDIESDFSDGELNVRTSSEEINESVYGNCVEIKIINYSNEKSLSNLMKELTELQTKNIEDIRYFQYFKGNINNKENTLSYIESLQQIKNLKTLDIHNGYVGTANLNDGERVNFALCSYDTGSYLVIGTPVIFTTY